MRDKFDGVSLYNKDCEELLSEIPENIVDLVVTSPPYDDLRNYSNTLNDWNHEKCVRIINQLFRVVKPGGVVVWVVGDKTKNGGESGTSFKQALAFMEAGFRLNDTMIWEKKNPLPQVKQPRYNQVFEYMFVFSKGKPKTFNPIMVPCKCAGQNYDSTCKNMGGENGRTKKSFKINEEKVASNIWEIAVAQNRNRGNHPAVFPLELAYKHIKTWSNEGDLVFDPFLGSGTTAEASLLLNRRCIGCDINKEYVEVAKENISKILN